MMLVFVIGFLCVNLVVCRENFYTAAVINSQDFTSYSSMIQDAAKMNADIFVLPSGEAYSEIEDYDEITKSISSAAKQGNIYVVAHLLEKTRCQNRDELVRNNLVFDRQGSVVADYRKPLNKELNCTATSQIPTFSTDFGISFTLLMEEDLVLQKPEELKMKNLLVAGSLTTGVPFLKGPHYASSLAYVTDSNIVTTSAIFSGRSGLQPGSGKIVTAELDMDGGKGENSVKVIPSELHIPEDLSQYIIRPLNLEASVHGYKETVCHGKFCCEFDVKTRYFGTSDTEVSYGLAVFDGVRHYAKNHYIGAQTCAIVACAGLYKRTCSLGQNNSTSTHFERLTVSGNFSRPESSQFPIILSTNDAHDINFESTIINNKNHVSISIENGKSLLNFGIFGRDYSKDYEQVSSSACTDNFYDYFFNDDVQEFFDYLWIRIRVLIFIVSIYVLEMM